MAQYVADVIWQRVGQPFLDNRYSRRHLLRFDGGLEIPGSSSPHVIPVPMSDAAAVDPEEAFVAALSSCHMLWFLSIAVKRKFCVDAYHDRAIGVMARNEQGKLAMTTVTSRTVALGDDHGRDGRHQSDFGAQTRLAVIAIAIALLLLLFSVIGWHRSGIPMALRAASRHRLSCGPPRVFALSLAQLNVLRT